MGLTSSGRRCVTDGCNNLARRHGTVCSTCSHRAWKLAHPIRYCWHTLKRRARRRKIPFSITLPEFEYFCKLTGYIENRGRYKDCASLDRKHVRDSEGNVLGYTLDNLQILTVGENSVKRWGRDKHESSKNPEFEDPIPDSELPELVASPGDPF